MYLLQSGSGVSLNKCNLYDKEQLLYNYGRWPGK